MEKISCGFACFSYLNFLFHSFEELAQIKSFVFMINENNAFESAVLKAIFK